MQTTDFGRYTMSVRDLSKKLGYNEQYVRTLANSGKIPAVKRIRAWRFDPQEIEAFLRAQTQKSLNR